MERSDWEDLSPEEKRIRLYQNQKELLDEFLRNGAITKAQYEKSFCDLTEKMGMKKNGNGN